MANLADGFMTGVGETYSCEIGACPNGKRIDWRFSACDLVCFDAGIEGTVCSSRGCKSNCTFLMDGTAISTYPTEVNSGKGRRNII